MLFSNGVKPSRDKTITQNLCIIKFILFMFVWLLESGNINLSLSANLSILDSSKFHISDISGLIYSIIKRSKISCMLFSFYQKRVLFLQAHLKYVS
jgi:hypothetical protein